MAELKLIEDKESISKDIISLIISTAIVLSAGLLIPQLAIYAFKAGEIPANIDKVQTYSNLLIGFWIWIIVMKISEFLVRKNPAKTFGRIRRSRGESESA